MRPDIEAIRMRLDHKEGGEYVHPEPIRTTLIAVCNLLESVTNGDYSEPASEPAKWTYGYCAGCGGELRLVVGGKIPLWRCEVCD